MIGCTTGTFTNTEDYRENVPGLSINLILTGGGNFIARLTTINTSRLSLFQAKETAPRIAFISLPPGRVSVSFPTHHHPAQIWSGVAMRRGEVMLHSNAQRFHQCSSGPGGWGLISVASKELAKYGEALSHVELMPPPRAKIVVPPSNGTANLARLHRRACRLAETKPELIARREVTRALEQDLLHAVANCLTAGEMPRGTDARWRRAEIIVGYEEILAAYDDTQRSTAELAAAVGVPERTLRTCFFEFLGMSPSRYARFRQLNLVRAALRRANPQTASVAAIARRYGFSELGRFTVAYQNVFGEPPSISSLDLNENSMTSN
jgi:AraC-like DNA-binding protein